MPKKAAKKPRKKGAPVEAETQVLESSPVAAEAAEGSRGRRQRRSKKPRAKKAKAEA